MSASQDLGRATHVLKVLLKAFPRAVAHPTGIRWESRGLVVSASAEAVARPRFVDFSVDGASAESSAAVVALSPKLRRLRDDRAWVVFDLASRQPLLLAPSKPAARRKKGLISLLIDPAELLAALQSCGAVRWIFVGGFGSVAELDTFLSECPPPEFVAGFNASFGWSNEEIRTPEGVRFFAVSFRGTSGEPLHDWYSKKAVASGLSLATLDGTAFHVAKPLSQTFQLEDCHLFTHNVHERSVATRH